MKETDIIKFRLANQQLTSTKFKAPEEILIWFGALQAQVYGMAKWALGLRLKGQSESLIDNAFNEGKILRTHMLRPTWHFVAPQDIRWMLALTAPRVHAVNKYYYKKFELNDALFKKAHALFVKNLRDGNSLTRTVLNQSLNRANIKADGLRLSYIFMQAELEGIICSGPREGKQFTYALLDERVPLTTPLSIPESLTELAKRYFTSRGPATLQDFIWWSGLTAKQANEGLAGLGPNFIRERIAGEEYIWKAEPLAKQGKKLTTFLMPDYDEYGISYKNRSAILKKVQGIDLSHVSPYSHMLIVDGIISGTWSVNEKSKDIEAKPFFSMTRTKQSSINKAIRRYKSFLEAKK